MKLFIIYIFFLCIFVELRKKKKRKKEIRQENPRERKPPTLPQNLYCEACKAILKESISNLYGKTKESDVMKVLSDICSLEYYENKYCIIVKI